MDFLYFPVPLLPILHHFLNPASYLYFTLSSFFRLREIKGQKCILSFLPKRIYQERKSKRMIALLHRWKSHLRTVAYILLVWDVLWITLSVPSTIPQQWLTHVESQKMGSLDYWWANRQKYNMMTFFQEASQFYHKSFKVRFLRLLWKLVNSIQD